MKILECSSKGDRRFSAFYARVSVFGKLDTIENHYQLCKRFGNESPNNWRQAKGRVPTHFSIKNKNYDLKYLTAFYDLLWLKYLDINPKLVKYAKEFDDFNDMFKGKSKNCQADTIRKYVRLGRNYILTEHKEFINKLNGGG